MSKRINEAGFANQIRMRHDNVGNYADFNGVRLYSLTSPLVHNTTSTTVSGDTAPQGSFAQTTNATGKNSLWKAGATTWQEISGTGSLGQVIASVEVADSAARLALTGYERGQRVYQIDNGFMYQLIDPDNPSQAAAWQAEPKEYEVVLAQSGTSAPTGTVIKNTLGAVPTFGRTGVGDYTVTSTGAFISNKTIIAHAFDMAGTAKMVALGLPSANAVSVKTWDQTGAAAAELNGGKVHLLVKVYPA